MNTLISETITAKAIKLGDNMSHKCTQLNYALELDHAH